MSSYRYRSDFYDFVDATSGRSAGRFLERLDLGFFPRSVLDVGCGRGAWLAAWKQLGVAAVKGVDGAHVDRARLQIPEADFVAADLSEPIDLGGTFDLVQCLEVGEHLPERAAATLVASVARHGDVVMFSAAPPGQGGEHHVNEQPIGYWVERFRALGYDAYDCVRPSVREAREIEPWYRYNTLLYANARGAGRLSPEARRTLVPPGARPRDWAPIAWRARCAVLRALPGPVVHWLARAKHLPAALARSAARGRGT